MIILSVRKSNKIFSVFTVFEFIKSLAALVTAS